MHLHRHPLLRLLVACLLVAVAAIGGGRHLHGARAGGISALEFVAEHGGEFCVAGDHAETAAPAQKAPAGGGTDCPCCLTGCLGAAALLPAANPAPPAPLRRALERSPTPDHRSTSSPGRRPSDPAPRAPPSAARTTSQA